MPGVELLNKSFFNEMTIRLPVPAAPVVETLAERGILAGVPVSRLEPDDPDVDNLIVLAATELTTDADIAALVRRRSRRCCNEHEHARPPDRHRRRRSQLGHGSSLLPNEPLLFEIGDTEHSGVDLPDVDDRRQPASAASSGERRSICAGLTEPEAMRHYVRLSRLNYSIDSGMYPLGSCTMKHNPRLNEKMARLPGFADIHPLQPVSTVQGALG